MGQATGNVLAGAYALPLGPAIPIGAPIIAGPVVLVPVGQLTLVANVSDTGQITWQPTFQAGCSAACSDPNPDHPRWSEARILEMVWSLVQRGALKGHGIVDDPVPFETLDRIYPDIAAHAEKHIKLAARYP